MDAVIKVFCVHTEPNYSLPWQRKRQYASTSSGFMVSGLEGERWLLTNAHSVEYSSQVPRHARCQIKSTACRCRATLVAKLGVQLAGAAPCFCQVQGWPALAPRSSLHAKDRVLCVGDSAEHH